MHLKPQDFAAGSAAHHGADENFREGVFRNFVWKFKFEVPGDEPDATGGRHIASTSPSDLSGEASMRRYGFALLVAAAAAGSTSVASAATPYDGRWSVVIQTRSGACDQAYRYGLVIVNGIVGYDGGGGLDVRGRVGAGGAVRVRVQSGRSYADGSG